jgi:hypothetical protein
MDQSGHTEIAQWTADDQDSVEIAVKAFREQLELGHFAVVTRGEGHAEQVLELPIDADLVILRRAISGG